MTGTTTVRFALAAAMVFLAAPGATAADLGIPRDGLDRVLLSDGRVVEARVLPREGQVIPLEFPAGTIRVPKGRVRAVRLWKHFDPAPRDEAEKAKLAEGCVRWKGKLVSRKRAEKERQAELAKEREGHEAVLSWSDARRRDAGKFDVRSNLLEEEHESWCEVLAALSKKMTSTIKGGNYRWITVEVHLYRDAASQLEQMKDDVNFKRLGGQLGMPDDPIDRVDVQLGGVPEAEQRPLVLGLAAIKLFHEMMGWQADDLGGWMLCGVPLYFAGATYEKGKLEVGRVEDSFLHPFRRMMEADSLPAIDDVLKAGNDYWKKTYESGDVMLGRFRNSFEKRHVPYTWALVHFLIHGERGKYRSGLDKWIRYWLTAKIGSKRTAHSASYEGQKALLLRCLGLKSVERLEESLKAYAAELEYRRPGTHLILAERTWEKRRFLEATVAHIEKARELAAGDAAELRRVGEVCAKIPGLEARATEILRASVEADPLAPESRLALAERLEGGDAERERKLGESLRGIGSGK